MKKVDISQFYSLGATLRPLQTIEEGAVLENIFYMLYMARDWLNSLVKDGLVPLNVSKGNAWQLINTINEVADIPEGKERDWKKKLTFNEAYNISNGEREFETVLYAELQTLATYFASQKLAYSTDDLIARAENLFPESVKKSLPRQCIADIRQAGKCIAFEIPTAAAFHILRATESVIRLYYAHVIGHPPKTKMRNWGTYIQNLEKAGADKKITAFLDHIREEYRNPILHPEEMLTPDDAIVLLGSACSAIVQMVHAINAPPASQSAQPASPSGAAHVGKKT
jgi:hypothetical protein